MREVEKLALYAEDGEISPDDVKEMCPPDLDSNIFSFVDSLASGQREGALGALEGLFSAGEPPLRVLYMMRRQFQLILRAKSLSDRGVPRKEIPGKLKVPPFVARKLEDQGRRFSEEGVENALALVLDLESGLKGGSDLAPELQIELAVLELCR
jgi:DNA polymerase-3 subunit delta